MYSAIRKLQQKRADGEEGFTLIELLVVIIIIGILAAIAIPVFLSQRNKAKVASVQADLRNAAVEMETAFTNNQTYPSTAAGFTALNVRTSPGNTLTLMTPTTNPTSTFCIRGVNADDANNWYYSSAPASGVQQVSTTACGTVAAS